MDEDVKEQLRSSILDALHANIEDYQEWDKVVDAIMAAVEQNTHYTCRARHLRHTRGDYSWREYEIRSWIMTAPTREALLEKMAEARIKYDTERDSSEYEDVEFGEVIHAVGAEGDVYHEDDPDYHQEIVSTKTWIDHQAALKAAKEAADAKAAADAVAKAKAAERAKEEAERAQYMALKAKYERKN